MNSNPFNSHFGRAPLVTEVAHGRVNLIGEHTDYNGGYVLPMPIEKRARVMISPRDDDQVNAFSADVRRRDTSEINYRLGQEVKERNWGDYLKGITKILKDDGYPIKGFDAAIESTVPMGSGLSSSAAFEVAFLRALRTAFQLKIDDTTIAKIGQRVENEFVGARVGIMDQMAASLGKFGSALFIDTLDLNYERVNLPEEFSLAIINSGVSHSLAGGEYNIRRAQCEEACAKLGIKLLRDLTPDDLPAVEKLPNVLARRARHVISENARVLKAVEAVKARDFHSLGQLFIESHASMRDDYEVSIPQIDFLVELACSHSDVYGARLTGGGFGGSVIVLTKPGAAGSVSDHIVARYEEKGKHKATVLISETEIGEREP